MRCLCSKSVRPLDIWLYFSAKAVGWYFEILDLHDLRTADSTFKILSLTLVTTYLKSIKEISGDYCQTSEIKCLRSDQWRLHFGSWLHEESQWKRSVISVNIPKLKAFHRIGLLYMWPLAHTVYWIFFNIVLNINTLWLHYTAEVLGSVQFNAQINNRYV